MSATSSTYVLRITTSENSVVLEITEYQGTLNYSRASGYEQSSRRNSTVLPEKSKKFLQTSSSLLATLQVGLYSAELLSLNIEASSTRHPIQPSDIKESQPIIHKPATTSPAGDQSQS